MNSILIFGCGNMGGAMLAGWLRGGMDPARFTVVDPFLAAVPQGVTLLREVPATRFDAVVLGIKPQMLDDAAPALAQLVGGETVIISMLAGVELASLAARFPAARSLVRVMPNLAAAIGKSPIALFGQGLDASLRGSMEALMAPLGTPEWLADEGQLDAVTALAGSGPAFVYRFIDGLAAAGAELGLQPDQARRLALAMVEGASALAAASPDSPAELARKVTSPGGTTAAGLAVLDKDEALARLVEATLRAARDRSAEMAREARR